VHWLWWKFTFRRIGARILVSLNDEVMFDVTDPEPLPGGHIGFWTVRNGFTVSRVTSIADAVERAPRLMYVADDAPSDWTPLVRDSLQLQHQDGPAHTRATATVGSGNMALRYTPAETIDLGKTPILKLPVDPGEMALGLHMVIGGHACLVQLGAPLSGMKALLVPEAERGECFKIPVLDDDLVRKKHLLATAVPADGRIQLDLLECWTKLALPAEPILSSLTIGNSSNADYLLAGRGGNRSGGTYAVGTPQFIAGGNGEGE